MKTNTSLTSYYYEPSILRSTTLVTLILAIIYVCLGKLSFFIPKDSLTVSPIFLPAGFALAAALILGKRSLLGIFTGSLFINLFFSFNVSVVFQSANQIISGFIISFGITAAAYLSSIIINRINLGNCPLYNGRTVLTLLILGSITYSTISSVIGTISLLLSKTITTKEVWNTFQTWWLGDLIGIVLITPFILSWSIKDSSNNKNFNPSELLLFLITGCVVAYPIFYHYYDLKYLMMPLLFWAVYRFGTKSTSFIILIIAAFSIKKTIDGTGPFIKGNSNNSFLFLDLFLCVISICSLFFSIILTEKQRAKTSTKINKNKLQKNETILEAIIESPQDISIYSLGRNYEYLNFNSLHKKNIKTMNNIDISLGMTLQESMINIEELNDAVAVLDRVFTGESITTVRHFDIDGSYWEFKTSPIINQENEIIGATVISTNISKKIKTEEALRKSEEKYRDIFTNIQDVIFQMDLNAVFLDVSPSVLEFSGYTPEELIGQKSEILEIDKYAADTAIEMIKEKKNLINYEKMIKTKCGELKPISLNAKLIFDKHGNPNHIDAIAHDITERKKNESKIALQNQKLQIQNKELEQFAYITSHDLQEPLVTLKYFSELLLTSNTLKACDEETQQYLNFILESSDRMQKLVKGLLDYSRVGNQIEISKEDCNEIVNNAIHFLSDSIQKTKAKITIGDLPIVNGYSVELIDLFRRLINNAIEFRKKEDPLEINITAKEVNNYWQFAVEDNGIGIEKQNTEKIFIIFKRLNNREEYPGIGISLAICKKIIALHGGNIWAESLFGEGTTIFFTIPKTEIDKI